MSGSPQWSPDGNRIAFDSRPLDRWEIYVADVAERKSRKLVTNITGVFRPHWSRDGKWIYFSSNETGRAGIYRCPVSGGDAVLLSKDVDAVQSAGVFGWEDSIFCVSHTDASTLKKVPLPGQPGTESEVDGLPRLSESRHWTLSPGGIYFVPAEAPGSVRYLDFANNQIRPVFEVDKGFGTGPVGLFRWPLDALFTRSLCDRRHYADRSLSIDTPPFSADDVRSFTVSVYPRHQRPNTKGCSFTLP